MKKKKITKFSNMNTTKPSKRVLRKIEWKFEIILLEFNGEKDIQKPNFNFSFQ